MPTAPNPDSPLETLNGLFADLAACAQEILQTPDATPDSLAPCLEVRSTLIRRVSEHLEANNQLRKLDSVQAGLQALVQEDKIVLAHLESLQSQVGKALDEIHQAKNALGSYRFPEVSHSSGIENRG